MCIYYLICNDLQYHLWYPLVDFWFLILLKAIVFYDTHPTQECSFKPKTTIIKSMHHKLPFRVPVRDVLQGLLLF